MVLGRIETRTRQKPSWSEVQNVKSSFVVCGHESKPSGLMVRCSLITARWLLSASRLKGG